MIASTSATAAAMLVRVQSPNHGMQRIECNETDSTETLMKKIAEKFNLNSGYSFYLYRTRDKSDLIPSLERKSLQDYSIKHGQLLYLEERGDKLENHDLPPSSKPSDTPSVGGQTISGRFHGRMPLTEELPDCIKPLVQSNEHQSGNGLSVQKVSKAKTPQEIKDSRALEEDPVDKRLSKQDGLIERPRDAMCRHGDHGKCIYCTPIEPYDEAYLKENNIKHLSFHSYIKKNTHGIDKGKFTQFEDISCRIKAGCTDHAPWPAGICTKCQPTAITLNRQPYRHVDNVMFENPQVVEHFLNYWRVTGMQRLGFLYGNYEEAENVPLGIRAKVLAIYEPPQESTKDSVKLLPDTNIALVDDISRKLCIRRVGWIFTDLMPEDLKKGTVRYTRHEKSYYLSAQECITAAVMQNIHPSPCRLSPLGVFGSKFVTVVVTGDKQNQVHMEGYQVSNQCMALVRDKCFVPTEAPEFGYVIESSNERYVPDVFYKMKDEYGNEARQMARPLPVEYLLVQTPVSTPADPHFFFNPISHLEPFPIENRLVDKHLQSFGAVTRYLSQFNAELQFLEAMSDFHLLIYIAHMETLPMRQAMDSLLEAIRNKDRQAANKWRQSEDWLTLEQLIEASGSSNANPVANEDHPMDGTWTCSHCTFGGNEEGTLSCQLCSLPR